MRELRSRFFSARLRLSQYNRYSRENRGGEPRLDSFPASQFAIAQLQGFSTAISMRSTTAALSVVTLATSVAAATAFAGPFVGRQPTRWESALAATLGTSYASPTMALKGLAKKVSYVFRVLSTHRDLRFVIGNVGWVVGGVVCD